MSASAGAPASPRSCFPSGSSSARAAAPTSERRRDADMRTRGLTAIVAALVALAWAAPATAAQAAPPAPKPAAGPPSFGPNVFVFTPSTPQSQIQQTVDMIASQQVPSQFGAGRFALLFQPGTYGSAANPLIFQVGYYTTVAGLGASP